MTGSRVAKGPEAILVKAALKPLMQRLLTISVIEANESRLYGMPVQGGRGIGLLLHGGLS